MKIKHAHSKNLDYKKYIVSYFQTLVPLVSANDHQELCNHQLQSIYFSQAYILFPSEERNMLCIYLYAAQHLAYS